MGDEFDDFEMDALIEEDDAMMGGGDADEEEAMFELEEASERAGVDATRATQATQPGGADDEDLDWLANAGATQTQAGADDAAFPDDDELDPADPGVPSSHPAPRTVLEPVALDSNARADAPARLAADIDGDAVPITSSDGRRVFVRAERERVPSDAPAPRESFFTSSTASLAAPRAGARRALLAEPIGTMLDRIESERRAEVLAESERLEKRAKLDAASFLRDLADRDAPPAPRDAAAARRAAALWVDTHAPKTFTELLSPEKVNREVLHWLKAWDGVVFKRAPPKPARDVRFGGGGGGGEGGGFRASRGAPGASRGASGAPGGRGGVHSASLGVHSGAATHVPLDEDGRPQHKILLLCGAPGVGKTTLAHVAARHAGYRVVEVNASDDRSAEALTTRVLDATQMRAVIGDKRPSCVVIDEIDGATGGAEGKGAIAALLAIVNARRAGPASLATRKKEAEAEDDDDDANDANEGRDGNSKRARRKKGPGPLLRPIVAVCNDPYAPALRPLREVAKIFRVPAPDSARLNQRLRDVCAKQKMPVDTRALSALSERAEGDVRACLNALQMLSQEGRGLTMADVHGGGGGGAGEKDLTVQARGVWEALLSGHVANRRTRRETRDAHNANLYAQIASFGDDETLLGGLFENVHSVRLQDSSMAKSARALSAIGDADIFRGRAFERGHFHLLPHVASSAMAVHACVTNAPAAGYLDWPQWSKMNRVLAQRRDVIRGWARGARASAGLAAASDLTLTETCSYLLSCVAPEIRPVAANFMKPHEAELLRATVSTMANAGLTYAAPVENQSFGALRGAHQVQLVLDPPVDRVCEFGAGVPGYVEPGSAALKFTRGFGGDAKASAPATHLGKPSSASDASYAPQRRTLPANVRQMLAHEVRVEEIRRAEASIRGPGTPPPRDEKTSKQKTERNKQEAAKRLAAAMGGLGGKAAGAGGGKKPRRGAPPVVYKYNEGITNAVRRAVFMRDLMR